MAEERADIPDPAAFPYVKRDLLRLLGTLSYENCVVQERMRVCGGIEIVMSHCVVDELNPCRYRSPCEKSQFNRCCRFTRACHIRSA